MREFVVSLDYEAGIDPVMDVFIGHPDLVANAVTVSVGAGGLTRVDRLSGPTDAISSLSSVYLDMTVCNECTAPNDRCDATRTYEVLFDGDTNKTVYTYHSGVTYCNSVPYLAARELPPGTLFDSHRRGSRHEWRLLIRDVDTLGAFYETLVDAFPETVTVSVRRLTTPERWGEHTRTVADLTPAQRTAIEQAVEMDYYSTPRNVTLADVSDALDVPQSTLRYRLRRAEAWLTDTLITPTLPAEDPDW